MNPVPDQERLLAARAKVMEALAEYTDGWSTSEGGLVVAFVAVFEVATPAGEMALIEMCGSGPEGKQPLQVWRREGMLHSILYGRRRYG